MEKDWKLKLTKCIIIISKKGKAYHYWKDCKNITRNGLYCVETFDKNDEIEKINVRYQAIYNAKEIEIFDDILLAIEQLYHQKLRDWKIKKLFS